MKQTLSKWNRVRKRTQLRRKMMRDLQQLADRKDAVPNDQIRDFLRSITLSATGHNLIRIGGAADGGYLLADDLDGIVACYSPGVSTEIDFDLEMAKRGIDVHLADASVERPSNLTPNMTFQKKFLGAETEGNIISLEDWITATTPPEGDLLLEIDIEGAEYDVLNAARDETLSKFRQIVLEVHDFDRLWDADRFMKIKGLFDRLSKTHLIIHMHHNNSLPILQTPCGEIASAFELTLLRKDRQRASAQLPSLPHHLDRPNVPKLPNDHLPEFYTKSL